ncbi:MAG: ribokinase [Gammaproteobacteria bacterium]|nr:ribokinase [Gammaproteobacteria bacterium]MDH3408325.1 ribokinase [Gammaproteobacteria bacterium]MDH3551392.1 ribokinase [Gammaproteobacteria bacterium]
MPSIVVIGSVNLDLVATVDRLPAPGETVTGAELSRFPGGKGANQALAAKRLGADVTLLACVGEDAAGEEALEMLRDEGVELGDCRFSEDAPTGTALIAVAPSGENHIVVAPGANRQLTPESLRLPDVDALICQLEVPTETIAAAAATFQGFFAVNLAPAMHVDVAVLQRADLVVVNESEAAWYGDSLSACTGMIATTFGAAGAVLTKNGEDLARAKPPRIEPVDTTAAGDTFTAALTVAFVEGQAPEQALEFACAAGAAAATKLGAQPSLPTREDVMELIGAD